MTIYGKKRLALRLRCARGARHAIGAVDLIRDQMAALPKTAAWQATVVIMTIVLAPAFVFAAAARPFLVMRTVAHPPASWAVRIFGALLTKRAYENIFMQTIADGREEHAQALDAGKFAQARWIHIRLNVILVWTFSVWLGASLGRSIARIWRVTG